MLEKFEHIEQRTKISKSLTWKLGLGISLLMLLWGVLSSIKIFNNGLGVLGLSNQIVWGIIITNFVFWIGVSHAGTFISAILLILKQEWRKAINRIAETMTIVAIIVALLMPIIHLGKPALFYKIFPFSDATGFTLLNLGSPLSWDFYAIFTYLIVSIIFLQVGLLPDWAKIRDSQTSKTKWNIYNWLSFGWVGSLRQWLLRNKTILILAMLATPLVISVHSIVSLDFAVTKNPGWHSTLFPIYFVTGAIMSGFAMILFLTSLLRKSAGLENFIITNHLENMNKIVLFTSCLMILFYIIEMFVAFVGENEHEKTWFLNRLSSGNIGLYVFMLILSLGLPQLLWIKKIRQNFNWAIGIGLLVNIGLWLERFVIVVVNSETNFMQATNHGFSITKHDWGIIFGSLGLFLTIFFILLRFVPFISLTENIKD